MIGRKKIFLSFFIVFCAVLYVFLTGPIHTVNKSLVYSKYKMIDLAQGEEVRQEIHFAGENPKHLLLPLTSESYHKNAVLEYELSAKGKIVSKERVDLKTWGGENYIKDPHFKSSIIIPIEKDINKDAVLKVKIVEAENGEKVTIRTGASLSPDGKLTVNGKEESGQAIGAKVAYDQLDWFKVGKAVVTALATLLALFLIGNNTVKNFVVVTGIMGVMFSFNNPLFEATDENFHFAKAYDISLGNLLSTKQGDKVGVNLPENIDDMPRPNQFETTYGLLANGERYDRAKSDIWDTYTFADKTNFVEQPTTAVYTPIPYIPQALGLIIANILGLKAFSALMLGRIFNLAVYIALSALAIKIIPRLKNTLAFLAAFPLFVSLSASFSADAILMGLNYLFIAVMLQKLMRSEKNTLGIKDFIIPIVLLILIVLCKFTYWPLSFLIFAFIGRDLFRTKMQGVMSFLLLAGIPGLIMSSWNLFVMKFVGTINPNEKINPVGQLKFILEHPVEVMKAFFGTFESGMSMWMNMLNQVGWVTHLMSGIVLISMVGLVMTVIFDYSEDEFKLRNFDYAVFILTIVSVVGLVMLSLYLTWSEVGADFISGLQGRYFLPVIPIVLFIFNERMNVKQHSELTAQRSARLACCMLLYANVFMLGYFY
ncbi:DUF2142 domain-containing protein [Bacillus wiedmannii]|uniref:DUF2142 domain-containing protein n=1 Tax=Bacillus wiedmannii TaxID=1890302 RepID=A0ABX5DQ81_9BACI|nr:MULTISPECIES: DUF2142 domain-containing protein [Bacillus cereus group]KAA0790935.1 DUF2142 domain-containing protein [Bacillus sp. BB081]KPU54496.1 hypothetical protein AN402_2933 [Bacillus wiedmannii]MCU5095499.1 DUF2142 domain-containing protein [Bacillus wiedmannii]PDZ47040.1 DUF2142 domain-containing protein [Bacillus wiedmannii]PRT03667.1 DUF2142 domain-containing protein [Bacillus wiedmannii]